MSDQKEEMVMYLSPDAPRVTVKVCGVRIRAENGVLRLTPRQAKEMDELMKTRLDLKALLKKVDLAKAEAAVAAHKAAQQKAAVAGPYASDNGPEKKLKDARHAQTSAALTGKASPVNHIENEKSSKAPVEVQEMRTGTAPAPGAARNTNRFAK